MIKKSLLMILITCSISACSNSVLIHEPVKCLGQPSVSIGLTADEYAGVTDVVAKKIVVFSKKLRARIDAQCEVNRLHDLQYID